MVYMRQGTCDRARSAKWPRARTNDSTKHSVGMPQSTRRTGWAAIELRELSVQPCSNLLINFKLSTEIKNSVYDNNNNDNCDLASKHIRAASSARLREDVCTHAQRHNSMTGNAEWIDGVGNEFSSIYIVSLTHTWTRFYFIFYFFPCVLHQFREQRREVFNLLLFTTTNTRKRVEVDRLAIVNDTHCCWAELFGGTMCRVCLYIYRY